MFKKLVLTPIFLALCFWFDGEFRFITSEHAQFLYYDSHRLVRDTDTRKSAILRKVRKEAEKGTFGEDEETVKSILKNIQEWMDETVYEDAWLEIEKLVNAEDWDELADAFYTNAKFGTAGIRGKVGVGPNRINIFVVRRVAQAVAEDLKVKFDASALEERTYLIAYDTREGSFEFAQEAASILTANGMKVAVVSYERQDRPVGWFSHVIEVYNCLGGLMITASHNPVGNNGIKLSAQYGGQLIPADGQSISDNYPNIALNQVVSMDYNEAVQQGLIVELGEAVNEEYRNSIVTKSRDERLTEKDRHAVTFVYDGLYGTDRELSPEVLRELGHNVVEVEEHSIYDPQFTGLEVPNPTHPGALDLARRKANELLGYEGEWRQLTGNEQWAILFEYLLNRMQEAGEDLSSLKVVKSWVTTNLIKVIAEHFKIEVIETPVGFKWIGKIASEDVSILAGFEESNGMTLLSHSKEKDGVLAAALMAEAIAWWNKQHNPGGKSIAILSNDADGDRLVVEVLSDSVVVQQLEKVKAKYGFISNIVDSLEFKGPEGVRIRDTIISNLVVDPPSAIDGFKIVEIQTEINGVNDGVKFVLEDESIIILRKSGTEPKLRIYVETKGTTTQQADAKLQTVLKTVREFIESQI